MKLSLAQIQQAVDAAVFGDTPWDSLVHGYSIDSRTTVAGDLFFALKGENFDGHTFIAHVFARGAAAAVVSQSIPSDGNIFCVPDTLVALQQLAHYARRAWAKPIVAITGSAGKTSTKDITAALLAVRFRVGKTTGNLNNHVGLPLSLLRIPDEAEVAVIEMGMNHAGEIRDLCRIAEPEIGLVTNVGYAHVENFDSIEGIAAAKRELIESLPATGTAVLNIDDPHVCQFHSAHRGRSITYGLSQAADVRADHVLATPDGSEFTVAGTNFKTSLTGVHNVSNVLAGLAVAQLFDIPPGALVAAVAALTPGKMRGERHQWNGVTVLNDSYNSNPEAARHMLDVLRNEPAMRRIAVLGEMRELGHLSEKLHRELGAYAVASAKIDVLIGIHGAARPMVEEATRRGMQPDRAIFFDTPESAGEYLKTFIKPGDTILFKGSRGTHVEVALAKMEAQS
jgi:UDP-N-acetylmuramoyl-tripeptide--D-alanyl-D-alanine ligase